MAFAVNNPAAGGVYQGESECPVPLRLWGSPATRRRPLAGLRRRVLAGFCGERFWHRPGRYL